MENAIWNRWLAKMEHKYFENPEKPYHFYKHFSEPFRSISDVIAQKDMFLDLDQVKNHNFSPLLAFLKKTPIFDRTNNDFRRSKWKVRPLMYADHPDAWLYSWYAYLINTKYENTLKSLHLDHVVSAYRLDEEGNTDKRTNVSIAKELFDFILQQQKGESCDILLFDIEKFYDTLHPYILKKAWARVLETQALPDDHYAVYKSIVSYGVIRKGRLNKYLNDVFGPIGISRKKIHSKVCSASELHCIKTQSNLIQNKASFLREISGEMNPEEQDHFWDLVQIKNNKIPLYRGIPQGLPISPVLANIYMLEFDRALNDVILKCEGFYRRYADDIVVVCPSNEAESIKTFLLNTIENKDIADLHIQVKKTEHYKLENGIISNYENQRNNKPLTYLGLTLQNQRGYIRSGTIGKGYQRIWRIVRSSFASKNPKNKKEVATVGKIQEKIFNAGLFGYVSTCANKFGIHINKQYSRRKIMKRLEKVFEKYKSYK